MRPVLIREISILAPASALSKDNAWQVTQSQALMNSRKSFWFLFGMLINRRLATGGRYERQF